jgi:hypothetical protein
MCYTKNKKPKELTQEQLFELIKELEGLTFPNFLEDYTNELQKEIDNPSNNQLEIPF